MRPAGSTIHVAKGHGWKHGLLRILQSKIDGTSHGRVPVRLMAEASALRNHLSVLEDGRYQPKPTPSSTTSSSCCCSNIGPHSRMSMNV